MSDYVALSVLIADPFSHLRLTISIIILRLTEIRYPKWRRCQRKDVQWGYSKLITNHSCLEARCTPRRPPWSVFYRDTGCLVSESVPTTLPNNSPQFEALPTPDAVPSTPCVDLPQWTVFPVVQVTAKTSQASLPSRNSRWHRSGTNTKGKVRLDIRCARSSVLCALESLPPGALAVFVAAVEINRYSAATLALLNVEQDLFSPGRCNSRV